MNKLTKPSTPAADEHPYMDGIASAVREWIADTGLSPNQVSRRAGISQSTMSRILGGRVDPAAGTLNEIALACGLQLDLAGRTAILVDNWNASEGRGTAERSVETRVARGSVPPLPGFALAFRFARPEAPVLIRALERRLRESILP